MNRWVVMIRVFVCLVALAVPATVLAQEAAVSGTVTDATGGVLPGVTITAVHEATGNTFTATSDGTGNYRLALRIGSYKVTAELQGFGTFNRAGMEVQVGQQAVVNIRMSPENLQESVTVTGDSPLVDVSGSELSKAIDARQMKDLPVNGRNWVDLAMLAAGSRTNASTDEPGTVSGAAGVGSFQLNLDGLRVTQNQTSGFGQPHYSRDAIAEFEYVSGRFDATQGGSMGVQINAVTKSGTNRPSGSFSSYFRDDNFVAKDFVQKRVLPYSDQQINGTWGGPIIKDRLHYFASYEYERQPQTITYSSPYPGFNFDQTGTYTENKGGLRVDYQISPQNRFSARGNGFGSFNPYDPRYTGGAARHPSSAIKTKRHSNDYLGTLTQVFGATTMDPRLDRRLAESSESGAHHRHADSEAARLHHRTRPRQLARRRGRRDLYGARQLHLLVQQGRPARRQGRRRVHLSGQSGAAVQHLHGQLRHERRTGAGEHRAAVPGVERHLDLESGGAVVDHAQLHPDDWRAPRVGAPDGVVGLAAGRLAHRRAPDPQPGIALRLRDRRLRREHQPAAVSVG
jgi:hypothetical protein